MRGLKYQRVTTFMTQAEVAKFLGITVSHYAKIERGEVVPNLPKLVKLAELFKVPIESLL